MGKSSLEKLEIGQMKNFNTIVRGKKIPVFFIKETEEKFDSIGESPEVASKGIIFETSGGLSLIVLYKFNECEDQTYCQWFNYYDSRDRETLNKLMTEEYVTFCIIDGNNRRTSFKCDNGLKFIINNYTKESKKFSWDEEHFNKMVSGVDKKYSDISLLFDEIK